MSKIVVQKPYQNLAWFSSAFLIFSAILSSLNIYPAYVICFVISSSLWTIVGVLWKERSIIAMNAGLTLIYAIGFLVSWLK